MSENKETEKDPKVKDLAPDKDAKGGAALDRPVAADRFGKQREGGGTNVDRPNVGSN